MATHQNFEKENPMSLRWGVATGHWPDVQQTYSEDDARNQACLLAIDPTNDHDSEFVVCCDNGTGWQPVAVYRRGQPCEELDLEVTR